jgi:hypothetical protein
MKKMNHVVIDTVCWIIVHEHTGIMDLMTDGSGFAAFSSPYLLRSQQVRV